MAEAAAALPQAARQLGDILVQAKEDHVLEMDTLTETEGPDLAIDTARHHLDGVREAALGLYRLFDVAHNKTPTSPSLTASRSTPKTTRRASRRRSHGQRTASPRRWVPAIRTGASTVTTKAGDVDSAVALQTSLAATRGRPAEPPEDD